MFFNQFNYVIKISPKFFLLMDNESTLDYTNS